MGIKEIAEKANVSKTTVSLALNGHKGVGHETRMRIIALAKEMNYRVPTERTTSHPSHGYIMFARIIKHGSILNEDQNIFIMHYIDGMNKVVRDSGYTFEIFDHRLKSIDILVDSIQERQPKGVIILGTELDVEDIKALETLSIPYVVIDTYFEQIACDFVDMANTGAVYNVVEHLASTGHKKICMITSTVKSGNVLMRERGFALAMNEYKLKMGADSLLAVRPGFTGAYEDMKRYIQKGFSLPEGIFCFNDVAAFGVIKALKESGKKVPRDISVVGFDDLPMSSMMEPHLTSYKVSNRQIGSSAARLLLDRLQTKKILAPTGTLVSGTLMIRDSVAGR
ncbi:MAG: LacI family DNA-binding transcriptional regulator [Sphaerochaetaceae bacterium]|nr:LacI family DNA-binding transcriptional regulator [Sphaerochaetaceae bacterium]